MCHNFCVSCQKDTQVPCVRTPVLVSKHCHATSGQAGGAASVSFWICTFLDMSMCQNVVQLYLPRTHVFLRNPNQMKHMFVMRWKSNLQQLPVGTRQSSMHNATHCMHAAGANCETNYSHMTQPLKLRCKNMGDTWPKLWSVGTWLL